MPVSADTLQILLDAGVQGEQLVAVVRSIDADMAAIAMADSAPAPVDHAAERRRAWDRERKRALLAGLTGMEWNALRQEVFRRDNFICQYCREGVTDPHCDHITPLSKGGKTVAENLTTACPDCNLLKGNKTPEEWRCQ